MRVLTADVLSAATKTDLKELEFVHLDKRDVEKFTEKGFRNCGKLASISLRHNSLSSSLAPLAQLSALWFVDLAHNQVSSLEGLEALDALGSLDLSHNRIKADELFRIRHLEVIHLSLKVQPLISQKKKLSFPY